MEISAYKNFEGTIAKSISIMSAAYNTTIDEITSIVDCIGEIISTDGSIVWGTKVISRIYVDKKYNQVKIEYVDPNDIDTTIYANEFTFSQLYSFLFLLNDLISDKNNTYKREKLLTISQR